MPQTPHPLLATLQTGLRELDAQGLRRQRRVIDARHGAHLRVDCRDVVNFASNDYLGLASHPRLVAALAEGARRHGAGSGGSHLLGGHARAHARLEDDLAEFAGGFVDAPRALYFSTGYMANLAVLSALAQRGATIFSDTLNHASLIDGARLSRAHVRTYAHADARALAALLEACDASDTCSASDACGAQNARNVPNARDRHDGHDMPTKLIVSDSVFSMDGDIAPLAALLALAEKHRAWLVIDDAHGFGVLGPQGRGALAQAALRSPNLVLVGTLGKAAGVAGAFVAAHETVIEWLVQRARPYIFTTAAPPAVAHAVSASLELIAGEEGDARRAHLRTLIERTRTMIREVAKAAAEATAGAWTEASTAAETMPDAWTETTAEAAKKATTEVTARATAGVATNATTETATSATTKAAAKPATEASASAATKTVAKPATEIPRNPARWQPVDSHTAVQPLIIGANAATLAVAARLERDGLWVPAIRPPTVPVGTSRLRISLCAAHSHDDLDRLHAGLQRARRAAASHAETGAAPEPASYS